MAEEEKEEKNEEEEEVADGSDSEVELSPADKAKEQLKELLKKYLAVFKNKKVLIPTIIGLVLLVGGLGYLLFKPEAESEEAKKRKEQFAGNKWIGPIYPIEFSVSLQPEESGELEYAEVKVDLELKNIDPINEIEKKQDLLTDLISNLFKAKKSREIDSYYEQDRLKERIVGLVNGNLMEGKIVNVYFTKFKISKGAFTRSMEMLSQQDDKETEPQESQD